MREPDRDLDALLLGQPATPAMADRQIDALEQLPADRRDAVAGIVEHWRGVRVRVDRPDSQT